ncbi:hypothetical protein ZTR_10630 [Talaromyces verruculosus]|nr:hypothetical protein ZTR_10630 [Talaromyces verruculosus]
MMTDLTLGFGKAEDVGAMTQLRPFFDDYRKEKQIRPENIHDIPMYLTALYSTRLQCEGSFQTFESAATSRKWLRVHASQEWHDLYRQEATDDLQRFYDFYSKNIQNGWESTPPVRLSLLGYDDSPAKSVIERPEGQWPPSRQHSRKYYLDANAQLLTPLWPLTSGATAHEGHSLTESSDFTLFFDKYTEIAGRPYAKLCKSCSEGSDFDVVVQICKLSCTARPLVSLNWSSRRDARAGSTGLECC